MRLTRGEGWWLLRRRAGETQAERAARLGISEDRIRRWEWDREASAIPGTFETETVTLTPGEFSTIARRRSGKDLDTVAWVRGISRQTLIKQEHDRTRTAMELARWWASSYPGAHTAAPIRVRSPNGIVARSREDCAGARRRRPRGS